MMADYRRFNLLPLEAFRKILGYNPWHFWGLADSSIVPVTSSCNDWLSKYPWQNTDAMGRDDIIEAIINAEDRIAEQLGYFPAPTYLEETVAWPKYHDRGVWNMGHGDSQGRWLDVRLNRGYVEAIGPETRTLLATAAIVYTDADGDGLRDTFTVTAATTTTDVNEIAVYIAAANRLNSDPVGEEYRIAPVKVSIAAGTATIRGPAWLCIQPIAYEGADIANPIDPTVTGVGTAYLTNLEVYRRYASASGTTYDTAQAALIWETEPYPSYAACCCCPTTTTNDTDPAAVAYGVARAGIRYAQPGIVSVGSAAYDTVGAVWKAVNWGVCRPPERVTVRYRAGYPLVDQQMSRDYQVAVARLAAAELARPICACDEANRELYRWQYDLARTGGANDESYGAVSQTDLDNPFGTRRGHVYAWRFVKDHRNMIGFSF